METSDLNISELEILSFDEILTINGGENSPAYNAGYAAGQYVQKVIAGVGILEFFYLLL